MGGLKKQKKNPVFSTFFEKHEKHLKSYSQNSCIFDITCGELTFFKHKMKSKVPIAAGTEHFGHLQNPQKKHCFFI